MLLDRSSFDSVIVIAPKLLCGCLSSSGDDMVVATWCSIDYLACLTDALTVGFGSSWLSVLTAMIAECSSKLYFSSFLVEGRTNEISGMFVVDAALAAASTDTFEDVTTVPFCATERTLTGRSSVRSGWLILDDDKMFLQQQCSSFMRTMNLTKAYQEYTSWNRKSTMQTYNSAGSTSMVFVPQQGLKKLY
jgi:hypothetical protein